MSDQESTPPPFDFPQRGPEPVDGPPVSDAPPPFPVAADAAPPEFAIGVVEPPTATPPVEPPESGWVRAGREVVAALKTLVSAAVYATLIVTFGFQIARVDGL